MEAVAALKEALARHKARTRALQGQVAASASRETRARLQLAMREQEARAGEARAAALQATLEEMMREPGWKSSPSGKVSIRGDAAGLRVAHSRPPGLR